jgi:hypothetical protein
MKVIFATISNISGLTPGVKGAARHFAATGGRAGRVKVAVIASAPAGARAGLLGA